MQNCPLPFFYSLFTREALWISDPVSEVLQESPPFGRGWVDPYGAGLPPPILAYGSPRRPPVAVACPPPLRGGSPLATCRYAARFGSKEGAGFFKTI